MVGAPGAPADGDAHERAEAHVAEPQRPRRDQVEDEEEPAEHQRADAGADEPAHRAVDHGDEQRPGQDAGEREVRRTASGCA